MKLSGRILRFAAIGGVATLVHFLTYAAMLELAGLPPLIANTVAFGVAFVVSFVGHRWITFRCRRNFLQSLPRFFSLALAGFGLNQLLVYLSVYPLGLGEYPGAIAAVVVVPVFTFMLSRLWVFDPDSADAVKPATSSDASLAPDPAGLNR
ncbi:MAG: GtrA family protein [Opitutales bacterium]